METIMARTEVEQVRLLPEERRELARVAKQTGRTKSDVLRSGLAREIDLARNEQRRREALAELKRMASVIPGEPKVRWRAKA